MTPLRTSPENQAILSESPPEITLWFAEELISPTSTLWVLNTKGEQVNPTQGGVDLNDPEHVSLRLVSRPLPECIYIVQWLAMLVDGDISEGSFIFAVGKNITRADLNRVVSPMANNNQAPILGGSLVLVTLVGGLIPLTGIIRSKRLA